MVLCSFLSATVIISWSGLLHPFPNQHWSMVKGGLPVDRSPWSVDQGSLMECIFVYLQKKIVFNLVMEQNKEQRQIELIEIRANFRKLHQIIRKLL